MNVLHVCVADTILYLVCMNSELQYRKMCDLNEQYMKGSVYLHTEVVQHNSFSSYLYELVWKCKIQTCESKIKFNLDVINMYTVYKYLI